MIFFRQSFRWLGFRWKVERSMRSILGVIWLRELFPIFLEHSMLLKTFDWPYISSVATLCAVTTRALAPSANHLMTYILDVVLVRTHTVLMLQARPHIYILIRYIFELCIQSELLCHWVRPRRRFLLLVHICDQSLHFGLDWGCNQGVWEGTLDSFILWVTGSSLWLSFVVFVLLPIILLSCC